MKKLALVLFLFALPSQAFAWGWGAHKLIAEIALSRLMPEAKTQVYQLIGDDFVESSIWADQIVRQRRNTAPWHYVDFPRDAVSYQADRDCKNDDCAVGQIHKFALIVADKSLLPSVRAEVLKFLIHFVEDIHQPLHASYADDRGGNEVWARIGNRTERLHGWWDYGLVETYWRDRSQARAEVESLTIKPEWLKSTPEDWANESFQITRNTIYRGISGTNTRNTPIIMPTSYADDMRPIIRERILMAGVRLAHVLNEALK